MLIVLTILTFVKSPSPTDKNTMGEKRVFVIEEKVGERKEDKSNKYFII